MSEIERTIEFLSCIRSQLNYASEIREKKRTIINLSVDNWQEINTALTALQEKAERDNPNPLTLDELREIDGEPVWFEWTKDALFPGGGWKVWGAKYIQAYCDEPAICEEYGKTWLAYLYKPKELKE